MGNTMEYQDNFLGTATYSLDDNKLRMYPFYRLDKEDYLKLKENGFKWAPKQELFVAGKWTPKREDLMLDFCGSIEDESMSPEDRAADRAERFAMYRNKRREEAHYHADNFDNGPSVHGYQNAEKAERSANRHDRQRVKAYTQWDKAEYWQERTKAVISHALYKAKPAVRRSRILAIEADQRGFERNLKEAVEYFEAWQKVKAETDPEKKRQLAERISGGSLGSWDYQHPRKDKKSSLYYLLTDKDDAITADEAVVLYFKRQHPDGPAYEGGYNDRKKKHFERRLMFERAMLENEGGTAAAVEMVPGGFIGKYQIHKVNRSNTTKQVVSVMVMAPAGKFDWWTRNQEGECLQKVNIQRCGEEIYTPPTDDQLREFNASKSEEKPINKIKNMDKPKLINPDKESAERLQALWNEKSKKIYDKHYAYRGEYEPTQIRELTQAQYSARSTGAYSYYSTVELKEDGFIKSGHYSNTDKDKAIVCKVRQCPASAEFSHAAPCVIVITDKPRKPLPEFKEFEITTEATQQKERVTI